MPYPTNEDGLTLKQNRFVDAYIETNGNGVQSAIKAGYKGQYSTVGSIAAENLTKPKVANAIVKRLSSVMDSNEVLERFSEFGRHKPKEIKASDTLKALELLAKYHKLIDNTPTVNVNLNHWQGVIEAQSIRTGSSIEQETRIALSLPAGIIPEDVRVELAKRLNAKENPE